MKLNFVIFFAAIFISNNLYSLSPQAKVSLLTVAPGQELYSTFGHSAFWIYDPVENIDKVYGYGTFDFETQGFYMKFTRGKLNYRLSVCNLEEIIAGAQYEQRTVSEQILNLSESQKMRLYNFLETNYLPENRYYLYDFYYDNCATRLRDALVKACGEGLRFNLKEEGPKTFRQLIDTHLQNHPFSDFGMDLGQGTPADKIATPYQYLFLPEELRKAFESASLQKDGITIPLVSETKILYQAESPLVEKAYITPTSIFWLLFFIVLIFSILGLKKEQQDFKWDATLLIVVGLVGLLLLFLWFGTDHKVTKNNWNLLWAMPLHIPAAFMLIRRINLKLLANYFLFYGIVTTILLCAWFMLPQEFNNANIPLVLLLTVRAFYLFVKIRKEEVKNI